MSPLNSQNSPQQEPPAATNPPDETRAQPTFVLCRADPEHGETPERLAFWIP